MQKKREVMGFVHHEDSADVRANIIKEIAYTSTMELVVSHHESRCICYQYSYMVVERRTIPLWPNDDRQAQLVSNELSHADSTECIERKLIALLLDAMDFAYNKDNADLCSTHIKDIAHHFPVKLVLSHQESRCFYQYFSHDRRQNNHLVMTQQRPGGWTDFYQSTKCRPNIT